MTGYIIKIRRLTFYFCCKKHLPITSIQKQLQQHSYAQSSWKDTLNSSIFICRLNAMYDWDVLTDTGRAFQAHAVATGIGQSPSVVHHVLALLKSIKEALSLKKYHSSSFWSFLEDLCGPLANLADWQNCHLNGCMCDTCNIRLAQQ